MSIILRIWSIFMAEWSKAMTQARIRLGIKTGKFLFFSILF